MKFQVKSGFKPTGDQPQAIKKLSENLEKNKKNQVLLGVTGSGKTFTMANVIAKYQKPTLVISHNKTLAGQLYQEFKDFFPDNAVSYFVSYYDYYQPEAYIPQIDTYIEKEVEINEEIEKLRLSATTNLLTRKDVIVVASVSCIYNIGSPVEYGKFVLELKKGVRVNQKSILLRLIDLQYERNEYGFHRGTFRVRGEAIDLFPAYSDYGIRIEVKDGKVIDMFEFDPLTGDTTQKIEGTVIYPAKHYMTDPMTYKDVFPKIRKDLAERVSFFKKMGKDLEAQRINQRTNFDLEMIHELGYVNGVENYSRYFDGRKPGEPPYTLLDYFEHSGDWLLIIDESHITIPQIRGMYNGDRARKENLIDYGFRLPSAFDNRPLKFEEFSNKIKNVIYVSATPNDYELNLSKGAVAQQLIRPTGIIDPQVLIKPTKGQIQDLIAEVEKRVKKKERVLITTLTKRMAEDLALFLKEEGIKISYLHSDIETLKRQDVLDKLREGEHDVIVGINLLREGLDLPEVSLVAILDADKEGFLRSRTSLIQTMGRAARHTNSQVIMYADRETGSMKAAIEEIKRRREVQLEYNRKHGITPKSIKKQIRPKIADEDYEGEFSVLSELEKKEILLPDEKDRLLRELRRQMMQAAKDLDFEHAALFRDKIKKLKNP